MHCAIAPPSLYDDTVHCLAQNMQLAAEDGAISFVAVAAECDVCTIRRLLAYLSDRGSDTVVHYVETAKYSLKRFHPLIRSRPVSALTVLAWLGDRNDIRPEKYFELAIPNGSLGDLRMTWPVRKVGLLNKKQK